MTETPDNATAAAAHVHTISGPTIKMGDGSYFDYDDPESTTMTIADYAWGLASNGRFMGQTRLFTGRRCIYTVLDHVCEMALQMIDDGHPREDCYAGLMHESDEVVYPDVPGPIKPRYRNVKEDTIRWANAINARFGVTMPHPDLIKRYDIRMLATEKRDLMPHTSEEPWSFTQGYEPFERIVFPRLHEDRVAQFLALYGKLRP